MKRSRAEGAECFALFAGAGVLANNLMIVAALLTKRSSRRSKAAGKPSADHGHRWNKTAAPHHAANRNPTWRQRINAENRAYSGRKFTQTMVSLGPVHRHN